METPEVILTQAINKSTSSSVHEGLSNVLKKLEEKAVDDFLNGEKNEAMWNIDNDIREIINTNLHYNQTTVKEKIDKVAQIIFTIKEYLQKGISNGDVRAILIFLGVNCYLQIEIKKLLSAKELKEDYSKLVSEKIIKILKRINLTTQPLPNAPFYEKKMMDDSVEGFIKNDIDKTYRMIEAIERGERGFHFNYLLENLLLFLFHINFTCFIKILSQIVKPNEIVFYLQSFKKEELIKIANESSLSNKWLNFEIIRQIVKKESKEGFEELETKGVLDVLDRICINDFNFFKQVVKFFHRSSLFNTSLGGFLVSISDSQIEEVICEFTIDKYSFNSDSIDSLREQFVKSASDEQFALLHNLVFNKWRIYFDNILRTEDFFQNSILLTDFANFVVYYHTRFTVDNLLISMMENLIAKIKFIDSEWTYSNSQLITKFHLYHSELFLLTFTYRNKRLNELQLLESYDELINNTIQLTRYASEETINYFKQGRQNIDWKKPNQPQQINQPL